MKIDKSTLKDIIMEEIASLDLDEVKLAPAIFNALKKMGKLPKGAVSDITQVGGNKGATKGKTSAELGAAFAKAASKPKQIAKGAKESNPAATKFDVMNKLEKKVGKMGMKVIVGALEKDPKLMTTLSMVLKEEVETLTEQTDPHAALVGAVAAALSRHASKLAEKKSEDVGKEIRDISRELSKEIADNFLKNFDAKQKD